MHAGEECPAVAGWAGKASTRAANSSAILQSLRDRLNGKGRADSFTARCPAHDDRHASLSVAVGDDGRVLVHCHAGCSTADVVSALGMRLRDLFTGTQRKRHRVRTIVFSQQRETPKPERKWINIATDAYVGGQHRLPWLADHLCVDLEALFDLRIGWINALQARQHGARPVEAFTIPERDGFNRVVGIALRYADGSKSFLSGGKRGLVIPASIHAQLPEQLYAVEGMSDAAALLTAGFAAVARASCTHGAQELHDLLRGTTTAITIVADRDGPGRAGGIRVQCELQARLKRPVALGFPPDGFKDVRAALIGGAL